MMALPWLQTRKRAGRSGAAAQIQRLRRQPPPGTPAGALLNLRVAWEHLEPPFEAFTYFLDELGFPPGDFVIADPEALPAEIADWFPFLSANELRVFGAVAVFRFHP